MNRYRLLFLLAAFVVALSSSATTDPNAQRGFAPDATYQFNEVDHINVFTGSPTVTIPIGQTYTSGDRLKYGLTLTYNSQIWDSIIYPTTAGDFLEMFPDRSANAGVGWLLSFGELTVNNFFIYTSPDGAQHPFKADTLHFGSDIPGPRPVLYTRDGSYLRMRDVSTPSEQVRVVDLPDGTSKEFACPCTTVANGAPFRLRKITDPFGNIVTVDRDPEPQGNNLPPGTTWKWYVREGLDGGQQTEHVLTFEYWPYAPYRWVIRQVDLAVSPATFTPDQPVPAGRKATYHFNYKSGGAIYRPPQHTASTQLTQVQTSQLQRIYVPLLESVELPDHSLWQFDYYVASGEDIVAPFTGRPYTTARNDGLLNRITYPTGGGVRYTWGTYVFPHRTCVPGDHSVSHASSSPGIRTRQLFDRTGADAGQPWRYISTSNAANNNQDQPWPYNCEPSTTFRNTIVDPLNNVTVNYFSSYVRGYTNPYGADPTEYGLPITRQYPDPTNTADTSQNRYLSTRVFRCTTTVPFDMASTPAATVRNNAAEPLNAVDPQTGSAACTELRKTYARFESSGDDCPPFDDDNGPGCVSANRRLAAQRTVYVDDGNSFTLVENSDFDGLGHYRTTRTSGNFYALNSAQAAYPVKHPHGDVRIETTRFNPFAQFNLANQTYCCIPLDDQPWILFTFDQKTETEEKTDPNDATEPAPTGGVATTEFLFDNRGFLTKKRILKGATRSDQDVVVTYDRVDAGSGRIRIEERYFGGDSGGAGTGTLPNTNPGNADYVIHNTYRFGSLEQQEYKTCNGNATVLLVERNEIDPATGVTLSSRDSSGAITTYLFDEMGRFKTIQPPGEARSEFTYNNVSSSAPANITIERRDGANALLMTSSVEFDSWGRVAAEKRLLPGGVWNKRATTYHPTGWIATQSTLGPDSDTANHGKTNYTAYDPFGRPLFIEQADNGELATHTLALAYKGVRAVTRTTTGVATDTTGTGVTTSTEYNDVQGRLQAVVEASAGNVATVYEYDTSGRLVKADAGTQSRSWQYDNRGFLNNEKYPEIDAAGITWRNYDARGHAHDKYVGPIRNNPRGPFDLSYQYDAAERLNAITMPGEPLKPLKTWAYYGNNAIARLVGKLRKTSRYNYIPDPTKANATQEVVVNTLYDYYSWNHRVSSKRVTAPGVRFATGFDYDGLGNLKSITYPALTVGCVESSTCVPAGTARTINYQYDNGLLKAVTGYVKNITYSENELPSRVLLQNNVSWVQDISSTYIPRPVNLRTEGTTNGDNWSAGPYRYDAEGNVYKIGNDTYRYDAVGRLVNASMSGTQPIDYQYDRNGNRTNLSGVTIDPATNRINTSGVRYDEAGNLTHYADSRDTHVYDYTFDRFNSMSLMTATLSGLQTLKRANLYDVDDERLATIDYIVVKPGIRETWSVRGLDQALLRDFQHVYNPTQTQSGQSAPARGWTWKTDYVYRGENLVATVDATATRYVAVDHLGTPRALLDSAGARIDGRTYDPYGEELNVRPDSLRKKYTGAERDDDGTSAQVGDVDYMHARFYAPSLGRFLSVDPEVDLEAMLSHPQMWNRYIYVTDNPLTLTDHNGRAPKKYTEEELAKIAMQIAKDNPKANALQLANLFLNKLGDFTATGKQIQGALSKAGINLGKKGDEALGKTKSITVETVKGVRNVTVQTVGFREPVAGIPLVGIGKQVTAKFTLTDKGFSVTDIDGIGLVVGHMTKISGVVDNTNKNIAVKAFAKILGVNSTLVDRTYELK